MQKCYEIINADQMDSPLVLSAPHCGVEFPESYRKRSPLSDVALLATHDSGTGTLVRASKTTAILAHFARSFVDLNRARDFLDPKLVSGAPKRRDLQILAGYGVLPRFAKYGHLVYEGKLTGDEAEAILAAFYDPYHRKLAQLLEDRVARYGQAVLIDVHSAPADALGSLDIQFGSLFGHSINETLYDSIVQTFTDKGYEAAREKPYAGGHITAHYARDGIETLQIEVNRNVIERPEFARDWFEVIGAIKSQIASGLAKAAE